MPFTILQPIINIKVAAQVDLLLFVPAFQQESSV